MDTKKPVREYQIINAIKRCASTPANVQDTLRARQDMARLRITKNRVCEAICDWIDKGNDIICDLADHKDYAGEIQYLMSPEIGDEKKYIKVTLDEQTGKVYFMKIVSAHEYNR